MAHNGKSPRRSILAGVTSLTEQKKRTASDATTPGTLESLRAWLLGGHGLFATVHAVTATGRDFVEFIVELGIGVGYLAPGRNIRISVNPHKTTEVTDDRRNEGTRDLVRSAR